VNVIVHVIVAVSARVIVAALVNGNDAVIVIDTVSADATRMGSSCSNGP
jgi:hypothetical protein